MKRLITFSLLMGLMLVAAACDDTHKVFLPRTTDSVIVFADSCPPADTVTITETVVETVTVFLPGPCPPDTVIVTLWQTRVDTLYLGGLVHLDSKRGALRVYVDNEFLGRTPVTFPVGGETAATVWVE